MAKVLAAHKAKAAAPAVVVPQAPIALPQAKAATKTTVTAA